MILITGGLGYLGIRITDYLLTLGYEIRIATSRSSPIVPETFNACECVKIDLNNEESLYNAVDGAEYIIHLAALDADSSKKNPESALLVNGLGTLKLLSIAESQSIKRFLYMSTVHVYGSPLRGLITESSATQPMHSYSITHRLAEDYVISYNQQNSLAGVVFRLSNAVGSPSDGEGSAWKLVVNDLCKQVVINKSIQLHSNRYLLRDFVPMTTVVKAVSDSLTNPSYVGEIFNLSSGISLSLGELADLISVRSQRLLGFKPNIYFNGVNENNYLKQNLIISNTKLRDLGFEIEQDISKEIDKILLNCNSWF